MANLQLPLNQDHEAVLGSEYCSGYMDALGKWNTGFYCPNSDESSDVFCCGTEIHKYCCTKKDKVIQSEVQDLTVLIGILVGATAAILIITMVSCFCCSCCLLYKKRHPSSASMYRLHNMSEHGSGVTNMYSLSNAASRAATPMQQLSSDQFGHSHHHHHYGHQMVVEDRIHPNGDLIGLSHSHTLPHNLSHQIKSAYRENPDLISHQPILRDYATLGRMPREQPPPYQDYLGGNENQILIRPEGSPVVGSISQQVSGVGGSQLHIPISGNSVQHQHDHLHSQQQQQQPTAATTTITTAPQTMVFKSSNNTTDEPDNPQLFHSTKF